MPWLRIMVGISGSGKSTGVQRLLEQHPDAVVVSLDDLRHQLTGDVSDNSQNAVVGDAGRHLIFENLYERRNVIYDATNVSVAWLSDLLRTIRARFPGIYIALHIFQVDPKKAKARICSDLARGIDRSRVPDEVVDRQFQQFLELKPVLATEFTPVFHVDLVWDTNFQITIEEEKIDD